MQDPPESDSLTDIEAEKSFVQIGCSVGLLTRKLSLNVLVDGQPRACLSDGAERIFEIAPGLHTVQVRTAVWQTPQLEIDVPVGSHIHLRCDRRLRYIVGMSIAGLLWFIATAYNYGPSLFGIVYFVQALSSILALIFLLKSLKEGVRLINKSQKLLEMRRRSGLM